MLVKLLLGAFLALGDVGKGEPDDPVQYLLQTKHLLALQVD